MQPVHTPVVILEGPDGTGKTTLAKHLSESFGWHYHHEGPPKDRRDLLIYYGETLYKLCGSGAPGVVIDRLHVGEEVYGPLLRGSRGFTAEEFILMNRIMTAYGVYLVFCNAPYQVALENWRSRDELVKNQNTFERVYDRYEELRKSALFGAAGSYDYTTIPLEVAGKGLVALTRISTRVNHMLPFGMIGSPRPRFLFVGDVANQEVLDLPFFSTEGCSPYFNQRLRDAGYKEDEIALCNSKNLDGKVNLALHKIPASVKTVIALGVNASRTLSYLEVPHVGLPHPQFWKRFHSSKTQQYAAELAAARKETYARA